MRKHTGYFYVFGGFVLAMSARAEQWFTVISPGANITETHVEVDLDSVRARGTSSGEAVIRVSYDRPQAHAAGFQYRSFVAGALFDCQRRGISLTAPAYYPQPAGDGRRLWADSFEKDGTASAALLDSIPAAARRALLKAACATPQTSGV